MSLHESSTLQLSGNKSISFLNSLLKTPPTWNKIRILDLTDVTFVTPVICALVGIAEFRNWEIIYPKLNNPRNYLGWMINGNYDDPNRYISLKKCSNVNGCRRAANDIMQIIKGWIPADTADDVSYSLGEALDNVFDHAQSLPGLWVQAQQYPYQKTLEIVVVDCGRGIAKSLKDNPEYSHLDDITCFEKALTIGISASPEKNSGFGVSTAFEWIKANTNNGARGVVVSESSAWIAGKKSGIVSAVS